MGGYGFIEFNSEEDADYAIKILNMIRLYGKPLRVNKASSDKTTRDGVGANLFVGNLDPDVDEKILFDTFGAFGVIFDTPKIVRDSETGNSKGHGFVSYSDFEDADAAIDAMNGQYLMNRMIAVQYAFKKNNPGERHGTPQERRVAKQLKTKGKLPFTRPNLLFSGRPDVLVSRKKDPSSCTVARIPSS